MRIPITIKIPVNNAGKPSGIAAVRIAIADISSGLEKISVRIFKPQPSRRTVGNEIRRVSPRHPVVYRPNLTYASNVGPARPRVRYSVKTFQFTIAWPTLPSLTDKLKKWPRKTWTIISAAIAALVILIVCLELFAGSQVSKSSANNPQSLNRTPVQPVRGTPNYATVLPAGKSIAQLGGWYRISPPNTSPVYTYADKIGKTRIDVSEQPLPAAFQNNTAAEIAQLAASYNATDKFTSSNNVEVYVGSSGAGNQSVILTKSGLLILIKSTAPLTNNQWTAYVSSLQ